jgi:hypothetical protein
VTKVFCSRCGWPMKGEHGPVLALLYHWAAVHGGVPVAARR